MKTFEEIYAFTDKVSHCTAFSQGASEAFYKALCSLPDDAIVLEVGVEHGRSASIILQTALVKRFHVTLIDKHIYEDLRELLSKFPTVDYTLINSEMVNVPDELLPEALDFVHIDGDHTTTGVAIDCDRLLKRVKVGGLASFHDWGADNIGLTEVKPVVDSFVRNEKWEQVSLVDTSLVMRRIA